VNGIDIVKQPGVSRLDMHAMVAGCMARRKDTANCRLNIAYIIYLGQPLRLGCECLAKLGGARRIDTSEYIFAPPVDVLLGRYNWSRFGEGRITRIIHQSSNVLLMVMADHHRIDGLRRDVFRP